MAGILERYGIKEVADVMFLEINEDSTTTPVLFLDTLKVSTVETTADQTEARGGKGNSPLIIWDYGKEITLTLQDAVYSPKSMAMIYGDNNGSGSVTEVTKYMNYVATSTTAPTQIIIPTGYRGANQSEVTTTNFTIYDATGSEVKTTATLTKGDRYIIAYTVKTEKEKSHVIEINASTFPGTYKVIGDTYARNQNTGKDDFFQFVIYQAKMGAETTLTLEAEGDPTVFDMTLRVLRPDDGKMMELIQYTMADNQ